MATMKQLQGALRRKNSKAWIERAQAGKYLTLDERNANRKWNRERTERLDQLRKQIAAMRPKEMICRLFDAAQFCVDVAGDEPSMSQLREQVAAYAELLELEQEKHQLGKQKPRPTIGRKYTAYTPTAFGIASLVLAEGDSLDELEHNLRKEDLIT